MTLVFFGHHAFRSRSSRVSNIIYFLTIYCYNLNFFIKKFTIESFGVRRVNNSIDIE